jgi:hypothetical protein
MILSIRSSARRTPAGDVARALGPGNLGVMMAVGDLEGFAGVVGTA